MTRLLLHLWRAVAFALLFPAVAVLVCFGMSVGIAGELWRALEPEESENKQ